MATRKKTGTVSRVLLSNRIEAASVLPNSKTISVFNGYSYSHIPNTSANRKKLTEKLGRPKVNNYRGKGRKTWRDKNIY